MKIKLTIGKKIFSLLGLITLVAVVNILIISHFRGLEKDNVVVINIAGFQRMLSQQITKLALGVANDRDEDRLLLKELIAAYDSSLKALQYGGKINGTTIYPAPAGLKELFEKNQRIWKIFKDNAQVIEIENRLNPAYSNAISYIRVHNEALLELIGNMFTVYDTFPNASDYAHEINIAGRQLMLFQKITKYAFSIAAGEKTEEERRKLHEAIQLFEYSDKALLNGGESIPWVGKMKPAPVSVKNEQKKYYKKWIEFRDMVHIIITQAKNNQTFLNSIHYLENNNSDLLDISNKITDAFTNLSIQKASRLRIILNIMLGIDLFILVLGLLLADRISRPIRNLTRYAKKLGAGDFDQHILIPNTHDEIEELSISFERMIDDLKATTVSKNYLNNIIGSMMDALLVIDTNGKICRVNHSSCELLGYEEKELLDLHIEEVAPSLFPDPDILKMFDKKSINSLETQYRCKNGELIPVCSSGAKMEDKQGRIIGIVTVGKDMTAQKKAERALRESEEKWRALAEHSPDYIMTLDLNGTILSVNKVEDGFTEKDVIGNSIVNFVPEKYKSVFKKSLKEVMKTGKSGKYETEYIAPNGVIKTFEAYIAPMIVSHEMVGFTLSAREITERKIAEKELHDSEELYHTIFEQAADSIVLIEKETGDIVEFNDRTCENLGYLRDEFGQLSMSDIEVIEPAEGANKYIEKIQKTGSDKFETKHRTKNGEIRNVIVNSRVLSIGENQYILCVFHDFTEIQQAEKKLKARQKEIEELNAGLEKRVREELEISRQKDAIMFQQSRLAAMGEMIGMIAHQWRQPLNALGLVLYNVQLDFNQNKLSGDSLNNYITEGTNLTRSMSTTIDDFRNFFKPNKEKEKFNINQSIHSALALVSANLKNDNISVNINEPEEIMAVGFPNEYSQVILNIIHNAKDAIASKRIKNGKISIEITRGNDFAMVKIQDSGGGIDKSIFDKIFIPYFTTKEGKGTGLGLYMSKIIIEDHMGGSLSAQNSGGGVEFKIITPLNSVKKQPGASK